MRWRILLLQLSFSKRRLRRILREAGGDASIRYSHFLAPDNARLAAWLYAGSIVGLGAVSLVVELPVLPFSLALVPLLGLLPLLNRTLVVVGDSGVTIVDASGVTPLSSAAEIAAYRGGRVLWTSTTDIAVIDGERAWSGFALGRFKADVVRGALVGLAN